MSLHLNGSSLNGKIRFAALTPKGRSHMSPPSYSSGMPCGESSGEAALWLFRSHGGLTPRRSPGRRKSRMGFQLPVLHVIEDEERVDPLRRQVGVDGQVSVELPQRDERHLFL